MISDALQKLELPDRRKASITVHSYLRDRILDGTLEPDSTISQVELSKILGVSRTPLREALRMLQEEGLIDAAPNQRSRVRGFNADDLDALYSSRILYDCLAVALTVPKLRAEDGEHAEAALDSMRKAGERDDFSAWQSAHREFHNTLIRGANSELVKQVLNYAQRAERYLRFHQLKNTRHWWTEASDPEHREILAACMDHDVERSVALIARHLARAALSTLADVYPEREPVAVRTALHLVTGQLGNGLTAGVS